jgi:hypothetical protein
LLSCLVIGGIAGACSSSSSSGDTNGAGGGSSEGGLFNGVTDGGIVISPASPDISVNPGGPPPTPVQFTVQGVGTAQVGWRVSNPYLGTIDASGLFTPYGNVGGEGDIEVTIDGKTVAKVHVTVRVNQEQNGAATAGAGVGDAGAGGLGGVGGEGLGGAVPADLLAVLKGTAAPDAALKLLYPYDATVFPLGILPPLLQWAPGSHGDVEAVAIHLSAPPLFDYKGYFARPAALPAGQPFVRHPIPKDVWTAATRSAAGSTLKLEVSYAAGGKAYGPLTQSYKIALAPFNGRIYYQAYATAFVKNSTPGEVVSWDNTSRFGAATLSIEVGAEAPKLVAGTSTTDNSGCRVCHSVSAYGDRMIVQHGDEYADTSSYDLKNGNQQSSPYARGTVGWAGLSPDGTLGLANSMSVTGSQSNTGNTKLYDMTSGAVVPSPGLNEFATKIGLPAFSPDSKHVSFTFFDGPGASKIGGSNGHQLVAMDFDIATKRFSNPVKLWEGPADNQRPAFLTFMPSSDAVVFQRRWAGTNGDTFSSWYGSRSELWWVDLATKSAQPLAMTNGIGADGKSYLPKGPNGHDKDETLSYEPSISPVASGGYAWMVFMSRRMYGNVATRDPYEADPRKNKINGENPSENGGPTTKKLWMAAIDLNAKPGADPSHPAFYIPGQEIRGVNSRPFFALQPCITDRGDCTTGIDCCSGFCRDGLCAPPPVNECSKIDEKCVDSSSCCDARARCVGGFCAIFIQ